MSNTTHSGAGTIGFDQKFNINAYSAYEIALLIFSSPAEVKEPIKDELILTAKESYLWAGSLVYILTEQEFLEEEVLLKNLRKTLTTFKDQISGKELTSASTSEIIKTFLTHFGIAEAKFSEILQSVTEAKEQLEKEGLIIDPLKKKILACSIAILSILPTNFTTKTEKGTTVEKNINALLWNYESTSSGDYSEATFNLRVVKIAKYFLDVAIPDILDILNDKEIDNDKEEDNEEEEGNDEEDKTSK